MPSVIVLKVVLLSVIMLSVVMLSVTVPLPFLHRRPIEREREKELAKNFF